MLVSPALFAASALSAQANPIELDTASFDTASQDIETFLSVEALSAPASLDQVTSVSQLSDVQPTDWAFQALQSLVERYGCIAGYPDGTFRGNQALTRYEFAAGLNACLDQILAQVGGDGIAPGDLDTINRLQDDFAAQLASLRGRVDSLESRIDTVEAQQFSTTTKLAGEVAFTVADSWSDNDATQTTFTDRVRLQLTSSFTGQDKLYTRLTAGNMGESFAGQLGTNEGRFAFDGQTDNNVTIDRLHYQFPIGDDLQVTLMASGGGHHFYADTLNPGLEAGGGASGALSRFGERNPIFRHNLGGQGVGLRYRLSDAIELSAGYLARGADNSAPGSGLFNGNNSYFGHAVIAPSDSIKFGLTYVHNHDVESGRRFNYGGTGTGLGNLAPAALINAGVPVAAANGEVISDSFGLEFLWSPSSSFRLGGWAGYTQADLNDNAADADLLNYALTLGFPDLFAPGNMGALIVGAEPYLIDLDVDGPDNVNFDEDVPLHVEALYKLKLSDGITITPGVIWLVNPNQSENNDDIVIGTIRTTFSF
ncbi:MAG: hypothetical protein EAZ61_12430 [Oscillatoriales cyanobacterium]|nr:MAG: hypothetical protein EAZ61_12430 [Oscillatoriales cyanobacterium]